MQFHKWILQGGRPVGLALGPQIPEQVGHGCGRTQLRGAKREAADRAHLLLELACDAGIDREVARIVSARSELVDQEPALRGDEHLHGHEPHRPQLLKNAGGQLSGFLRQFWIDGGGGESDVEDVLGMGIFENRCTPLAEFSDPRLCESGSLTVFRLRHASNSTTMGQLSTRTVHRQVSSRALPAPVKNPT